MSNLNTFRSQAAEAMVKYREIYETRRMENGTIQELGVNQFKEIFSILNGYNDSTAVFYSPRCSITGWTPEVMANTTDNVEAVLEYLVANRMKSILWFATLSALADVASNLYSISVRNTNIYVSANEQAQTTDGVGVESLNLYQLLMQIRDIKIEKIHLVRATTRYNDYVKTYTDHVLRIENHESKNNGIAKVFEAAPKPEEDLIKSQLAEAIKLLPSNGLTARTWGFEVEVPDAKGVDVAHNSGIQKGEDGSLRSYEASDDCECGCSDCTYHVCDCDNCDSYNEDVNHCGDGDCATADSAEFRTVGGIQRVQHAGLRKLCKDLNEANAEINDTAGTHIHVYAQDLTTSQVGQVMAIYKFIEGIVSPIAGRYNVNYAGKVRTDHVSAALKRNSPKLNNVKQIAVNVMHLLGGRGTIEFRQMDCNLDADKITFWAWLVRGLVETAKRGATLRDFKKVADLNDVIDVLGKFNYFIQNETPDVLVYGTKSDMGSFKLEVHDRIN